MLRFSDQNMVMLRPSKGESFQRSPLAAFVAGTAACCFILSTCLAANATRLPQELKTAILTRFPEAHVRLDGSVETKKGELFLPLLPASYVGRSTITIELSYPTADNPELLIFNNGWCYLKVIKKGVLKTVIAPNTLPEPSRKKLLACKFPGDLIVPENIAVPRSLKAVLGDVLMPTVDDTATTKPDFGQPPKPKKPVNEASGLVFVTSPSSGKITLLDGGQLSKLTEFPTEGTPAGMAYAEGHIYIADQAKSRVLILDPKSKQFLGQIDLPKKSAPKGAAALPNGKLLYVSESATNSITVVETATNKVLLRTKVPAGPARLAMTPNGFTLLILNVPSGQVSFLSTLNQRLLGSVDVGAMPNAICVSKDSLLAYVSNRVANTVSVIDITKRQVIDTLKTGAAPTGLALNADGTRLFVANARDNTISVFDLKNKKKLEDIKLPLDVDFPGAIALMPDGARFLVSSEQTEAVGILDANEMRFLSQPVIGHTSDEILWVPSE